jgi:23S rRNA pseudouridine2605 synthase
MISPTGERLNRFLARRGVASRRHADELISDGRVTVNGGTGQLGSVIDPKRDTVRVDGKTVPGEPAVTVTIVMNKPAGVVTTRHDPQRRPTVMQLVQPVPGLVPVGRLDADSRGLLLLTNDGELAHRVSHPKFGVHKRYRVVIDGDASDGQLSRMTKGIKLDDGVARALEARRGRRPGTIEVVMGEGRRREVRRLCDAVGLRVVDLVRVAVGPVELGRLPEGKTRPLSEPESASLMRAVGLAAAAHKH